MPNREYDSALTGRKAAFCLYSDGRYRGILLTESNDAGIQAGNGTSKQSVFSQTGSLSGKVFLYHVEGSGDAVDGGGDNASGITCTFANRIEPREGFRFTGGSTRQANG